MTTTASTTGRHRAQSCSTAAVVATRPGPASPQRCACAAGLSRLSSVGVRTWQSRLGVSSVQAQRLRARRAGELA